MFSVVRLTSAIMTVVSSSLPPSKFKCCCLALWAKGEWKVGLLPLSIAASAKILGNSISLPYATACSTCSRISWKAKLSKNPSLPTTTISPYRNSILPQTELRGLSPPYLAMASWKGKLKPCCCSTNSNMLINFSYFRMTIKPLSE